MYEIIILYIRIYLSVGPAGAYADHRVLECASVYIFSSEGTTRNLYDGITKEIWRVLEHALN